MTERALPRQVFGSREGAKIYGVLFSAFATASIVGAKLTSVSAEFESVYTALWVNRPRCIDAPGARTCGLVAVWRFPEFGFG